MSSKNEILQQLLSIQEIEPWQQFEYQYFGPTTRTISFFGPVCKETTAPFISQLLHLAEEDSETPIVIWLNTEGGSLTDGLAIYDTIVNLSCPVEILVTGLCASAGLIILSAGDYRLATKSSTFYYHQPVIEDSMINSIKDMDELQKYYKSCKDKMDEILKSRTKMRKQSWSKNFEGRTSYYFFTEDALKYKLIDKIVESDKVEFEIQEKN
jgi:ATP-dependent Clp protease, protease subunit